MTYYDAFKQVRNRIRKYDAKELVLGCIARLHAPDAASVKKMSFQPPWLLLLLIKWAMVHGDFSWYEKRPLDDKELDHLVRMMQEVDNVVPHPTSDVTPLRLLRPIAYQQVWHQQETFASGFARQALLFGALPPNHTFQQWFRDDTGVNISDFLEIAFVIAVQFFQPGIQFFKEGAYFRNLEQTFPSTAIPNFLKTVARTPNGVREYLLSLEEEKRLDGSEFRELSPLTRYPLLNIGGRYYYYTRRLLTYSLENFIYDTLRRHDAQGFMDRFGDLFERYVRMGLEFSGVKFFDEDGITRLIKEPGKRTDFLISEPGVNVFIDAKGVEVGHLGMTSYRQNIVTDKVRSSVLKGIHQGMDTVASLRRSSPIDGVDLNRTNNFLFLVTYKDLILGTGRDFYESFAGDRLDAMLGDDPANSPIPLEHIYIISAEEFDQFVAYVAGHRGRVADILGAVSTRDGDTKTKKLFLFQHLYDLYGNKEVAAYLRNQFDDLGRRVADRLKR